MTIMYAKVVDNKVVAVATIEAKQLDNSGQGQWIDTDTDMNAGVNLAGGTPLRYNFAQVGGTYDPIKDAFIGVQPFPSWKLNSTTLAWEAPVAPPGTLGETPPGEVADWNESTQSWEVMTIADFEKKHGITVPTN